MRDRLLPFRTVTAPRCAFVCKSQLLLVASRWWNTGSVPRRPNRGYPAIACAPPSRVRDGRVRCSAVLFRSSWVPQTLQHPRRFPHFLPSRHRALSVFFSGPSLFFFNLNLWSVVSRATALRRHLVDVHRRTVLTAVRLLVAPNEGYD